MKKLSLALLLTVLATTPIFADKGMWLLQLMRQQNLEDNMRKLGLQISADEIYSPEAPSLKDAIGIFGGGCTGEVISPNGLVVTNHHCGFGFIQQLSTMEHNYLQNGFWSQSNEEELPCKGIGFTFVVKITDVTDEINARIANGKISEEQSFNRNELAKIGKELFDADNIEGKEYMYPQLLPYFEANKYYLVYYKRYTDVRLVGTPPFAIGKFGGIQLRRLRHDNGLPRKHIAIPHRRGGQTAHVSQERAPHRHARPEPEGHPRGDGEERGDNH